MKKSTNFNAQFSESQTSKEKSLEKELATSPKKEVINNILAFSKAYSVRKSEHMDKMEFNLN